MCEQFYYPQVVVPQAEGELLNNLVCQSTHRRHDQEMRSPPSTEEDHDIPTGNGLLIIIYF